MYSKPHCRCQRAVYVYEGPVLALYKFDDDDDDDDDEGEEEEWLKDDRADCRRSRGQQ